MMHKGKGTTITIMLPLKKNKPPHLLSRLHRSQIGLPHIGVLYCCWRKKNKLTSYIEFMSIIV
ncbi:MAG TPA: hypothetical protein VMU30_08385 [Bacteroidota bacterium]|nr:hypothetical protein [Bacteroidota bacterium]